MPLITYKDKRIQISPIAFGLTVVAFIAAGTYMVDPVVDLMVRHERLKTVSRCITFFDTGDDSCKDSRYKTGFHFSVPYFGMTYHGFADSVAAKDILRYGAFEKPVLAFLRDLSTKMKMNEPGTVALDVGAFRGTHSMVLSKWVSAVHSFEPNPKSLKLLLHNVAFNKLDNVTVHQLGLAEKDAVLDYHDSENGGDIVGSFVEGFRDRLINSREFRVVQGDNYITEQGIEGIKLVKIDVEGYEGPVIKGLRATLRKNRPVLVVEVTPSSESSFPTVKELRKALPENYTLLKFADYIYSHDASYKLESFPEDDFEVRHYPLNITYQPEVVAVPDELLDMVPKASKE